MALQYLKAKLSILPHVFSPTFDAIFSTLPFWQRWRLLLLQPLNIIGALLCTPQLLLNNRYSVIYVPTRKNCGPCTSTSTAAHGSAASQSKARAGAPSSQIAPAPS
jgi:hypothetical protein